MGLGVIVFTGEFDRLRDGVVAGAGELNELGDVGCGEAERGRGGGECEVLWGEFDGDFVGGGVGFAEVRGVAEAEGGGFGRGNEGAREFYRMI